MKAKSKSLKKKEEVDPEFAEFLEIHSKRQKDKTIWDNDGIDGSAPKPVASEEDEGDDEEKVAHKKELSDLEVQYFLSLHFLLYFNNLQSNFLHVPFSIWRPK